MDTHHDQHHARLRRPGGRPGGGTIAALSMLLAAAIAAAPAGMATTSCGAEKGSETRSDPRIQYFRAPEAGATSTDESGSTIHVAMSPGAPPVRGPGEATTVHVRRSELAGDVRLHASGRFAGRIQDIKAYLYRGTTMHEAVLDELWVELAIDGATLFSGDARVAYNGHPLVTCHPHAGWYALRLTGIAGALGTSMTTGEHTIDLTVAPPGSADGSAEVLGLDAMDTATRIFVNPPFEDRATPRTAVGP